MQIPAKTTLITVLLVAALMTTLAICAERSRSTEIKTRFERERAAQIHSAEKVLSEALQEILHQNDKITPENFSEYAVSRSNDTSLWQDCRIAFVFCELAEDDDAKSAHYAGFYGVAGLGSEDETTPNQTRKKNYPGERIAGGEAQTLIDDIVRFADTRFPLDGKASWQNIIPPLNIDNNPSRLFPRYGLWLGYFHGSQPMSEKYFSSGFRFETNHKSVFLVREVRAPQIRFSIQGILINQTSLLARLNKAASKTIPNIRLEITTSGEGTNLLGIPLKIHLQEADFKSHAKSLREFRIVLLIVWLCSAILLSAIYAVVVHIRKLADLRRLFSDAIVHELRTPLALLEAQAEALAIRSEAQTAREANALRLRVQQLTMLADNLFWMAKMSQCSAYGLQASCHTLEQIMPPVLEYLAEILERRGVDLTIYLPTELTHTRIWASPTALERIFANLADNAAKHLEGIDDAQVTVSVSRSTCKNLLQIRFSDNAGGIPERIQQNLFRDFTAGASGLGIGLALSRKLARAQKGDLALLKTSSKGTSLQLTLKICS